MDSSLNLLNAVFSGITAAAAVLALIIALKTDWFWRGKKLILKLNNRHFIDGSHNVYYHIDVINERPSSPAEECKIQLEKLFIKRNSFWEEHDFGGTLFFKWQHEDAAITLVASHILDFLVVKSNVSNAQMRLTKSISGFDATLKVGEHYLFQLAAIAYGYKSKPFFFEVVWSGMIEGDINASAKRLSIDQVSKRHVKKSMR